MASESDVPVEPIPDLNQHTPYPVIEAVTRPIYRKVLCMAKAQQARRYRQLPPILRRMRTAAGLTQRELPAKLDTSHVFVHKSETGE